MANPEHLAILKQGAGAWNEWRVPNREVAADLSGADLSNANLSGVNFHLADLTGANLTRAKLLSAHLTNANFTNANLTDARLIGADLYCANLTGANFTIAMLVGARLSGADLTRANLTHADLQYSQLVQCKLEGAMLTGARLYGSARDDWVIQDVECEYIYLDFNADARLPQDRDVAPGEFEQLYRSLPIIEYVFRNGMTPLDPLIMDRVVQAIREQNPEYHIKIDSISARGLAPSIKFTVQREEQKEPALQMIVAGYESRLRQLEGEKNRLYDLLALAIDKAGTKLLVAGRDIVNAEGNATINIDQHVEYITNLRDDIAALPEDSPTFAKVAKKTALDIIGSALKDVAKGQVKDAAEQIIELGKDLGPVIVNTAAYAFFKSCLGL